MTRSIKEQCDNCRHFTGVGNDGERNRLPARNLDDIDNKPEGRGWCAAGVKYNEVIKSGKRMIALPCFHPEPDNMPADGVWPTCPKQSFKSLEEIEQEEREINDLVRASTDRITVVRPAIIKHAGEKATKGMGAQGSFECPVCKSGTLHYTISSYNGHVHAHCSTDDCVSWME